MIYTSRGGAFGKISIRVCPLEERAGELIVSKRLGMLIRIPGYRKRPGDNVGIHHTWKSTICIWILPSFSSPPWYLFCKCNASLLEAFLDEILRSRNCVREICLLSYRRIEDFRLRRPRWKFGFHFYHDIVISCCSTRRNAPFPSPLGYTKLWNLRTTSFTSLRAGKRASRMPSKCRTR